MWYMNDQQPASDRTGSKNVGWKWDCLDCRTQTQFNNALVLVIMDNFTVGEVDRMRQNAELGCARDFALYAEYYANGEVR
jgi:hypothetical protein